MNVSTDKLLAIKAFYLGHGIREQAEFKVNALKMIDSAINYLSEKEGLRDIKRLIFYKLIKCEILRFDVIADMKSKSCLNEPAALRSIKTICPW